MLNQSNDKITSSFKTEFHKFIQIEINSIKVSLSLQNYMQKTILSLSDKLWNKINSSSDIEIIHNTSKDLYDISSFSFQLQSNISSLEKLVTQLETLSLTTNIEQNDLFFNKINQCHDEAIKLVEQSLNFNSSFDDFITNLNDSTLIQTEIDDDSNNTTKNDTKKEEIYNQEEKQVIDVPDDLKENTLIISDTEVILPFTKKDLEDKLKSSNLSCYQEVIDTFYKKSTKSFEPSAISRFKEAYSLILNKEHGSKFQAISLGLELSTNYNLHPAIISACKDLTQLDVYLSCLEYKELSDFHFFDIVYNIPPTPKKHLFKKFIENT